MNHRSYGHLCGLMFVWGALAGGCASHQPKPVPMTPAAEKVLAELRAEAESLRPHTTSQLGQGFLDGVAFLPPPSPRVVYRMKGRAEYYTEPELANLASAERAMAERRPFDEAFYYSTKYGTPVAYTRAVDLLGSFGVKSLRRKRVLDFGYGGVGSLRLLALSGADAVGVDVDPLLPAIYSDPADQGRIAGGRVRGSVKMVHGRFPAENSANKAVGGKYDLVISKNTLKRGYIHPPENVQVDPKLLIRLGVDDEAFLRVLHNVLKPGGRVMIYNICPAPAPPGKPYIPWADGRSPFTPEQWEAAGFRVLAFDVDDSAAARAMGRALGWDQGEGKMDLDADLFAWYTLVERP